SLPSVPLPDTSTAGIMISHSKAMVALSCGVKSCSAMSDISWHSPSPVRPGGDVSDVSYALITTSLSALFHACNQTPADKVPQPIQRNELLLSIRIIFILKYFSFSFLQPGILMIAAPVQEWSM